MEVSCIRFLVISLALAIAAGCSNKMNKIENNTIDNQGPTDSEVLIQMDKFKGKCRKCPQYSIKILDSTKAMMIGKHNVPVLGESFFDIHPNTYEAIIEAFEEADFHRFKTEYLTNFADLAKTTITYKGHTIVFHDNPAPKKLLGLSRLIDELIAKQRNQK